ncbi:anti-sigma factor [Candidatus Contubernalis alkaliaceticus]|uniref:hypothetical protein n=1 Tax=Candidatus Contubernalis alkaliaceticus TaxID=338645 RepID=UPI001F4BEFFE|nr:hypothetical protein [Candidatus Contubernalis alkalaceticus]UNC91399.1 hypothetical protein HUE98_04420 [Candidatus Contubernalis alkalaceticus]
MKKCPDQITWQSILDGEESGIEYFQHLEHCSQCQKMYLEIQESIDLAMALSTDITMPKDFPQRMIAKTKPFPAGLLAGALFILLTISVIMLDTGIFSWWITVGVTAYCGLLIDILLEVIKAVQRINPTWWLMLAAVMAVMEIFLLIKLQTIEE